MKVVTLPSTLFVESKDIIDHEIVTDEIKLRVKRLAQDLILTTNSYQAQLQALEDELF